MLRALVPAVAFVACIAVANWLTSSFGMVPVGFGLAATAGTYTAGLMFVLRDLVQDAVGRRWVLAVIGVGAAVSFLVAAPAIALASAAAFAVSESADMTVYTPLRERGYVRAAVSSNVVGAFLDTVVFLWVAGFPVWGSVPGQMTGKLMITLAVVALVTARRTVAVLRQPVRP